MTSAPLALPILAADIGGTNTRVALLDGLTLRDGTLRRFPNAGVASLNDILTRYLTELDHPALGGASVAAAGPVRRATPTAGWATSSASASTRPP